jgi:N-acetylmuramoyl-L-alanine amidase
MMNGNLRSLRLNVAASFNKVLGTAKFIRRFPIILILIVLVCSASFAADKVKILKVETKKIDAYEEVSVFTSENIKPEIIMLESPNRIALAFSNATIDAPVTMPGASPLISMIQAAQFDEKTVYVIVEPNETLSYDYASIIGRNKFILEFTKAKPESAKVIAPSARAAAPAAVPATVEAVKPGKVKPAKPEAVEVAKPTVVEVEEAPPVEEIVTEEVEVTEEIEAPAKAEKPVKKIRPVEISNIPQVEISKIPLSLQGKTVIVDPGHGGRDPGFISKSGIFEKVLNLKIALRLEKFLKKAGAKVIMTRTRDVSVKNSEVVRLTNKKHADIFVAIHLNAYSNPRIGGSQTFYYTPKSKKFAKIMQNNICRAVKLKNRGTRKFTYYVVHHSKMPSVLIEAAYLTNPKEEKLILDPKFQDQLAYGMYKGIKEYVKISSWQRSRK